MDVHPGEADRERVTGLIERVVYHSPDSGFTVLKVDAGRREPVSVVATLAEAHAGEWVDAVGRWQIDPDHGQQFRAERVTTTHPGTAEGMARYLGSGLIKGIGPAFAARLVRTFGEQILEVIEREPGRLLEVPGIGRQRQSRIVAAWKDQQHVRRIMVFLHRHGVGTSRAFRIYRTYGDDAVERISADPYCLARDIHGVGFRTADRIAASIGIARDSAQRARAGVEHALLEVAAEGHCACERPALVDRAVRLLDAPRHAVEAAVEHGIAARRIVPSITEDGRRLLYLGPMEAAERGVARALAGLLAREGEAVTAAIDAPAALRWVEARLGFALAPAQRDAVAMALASRVTVITGGPGTGKTTTVDALLRVLVEFAPVVAGRGPLRILLAAPTGRAAKRLSEATGREASTIHRLLEWDPKAGAFRRNEACPLEADVLVVDESSMLDLPLAHQLLRAVPATASVAFVGDVDQLPPVGPGQVLRDLIDSSVVPTVRLEEVFRQAQRSDIVLNAHRINRGDMALFPAPRPRDRSKLSDCYFVGAEEPERILGLTLRLVRERIPERFGLDPMNDVQVLTPTQRGELGARALNAAIQRELNPSGPAVERFGRTYRVGDKVMQLVNDYDKLVFNGDIGRIAAIDEQGRELLVRFDGGGGGGGGSGGGGDGGGAGERDVAYDFAELDALTHAYAITVHKSQGSEYPAVVLPLHASHHPMLRRNLLYTALTRGRKLVVIVGPRLALAMAIRRTDGATRTTELARRLRSALAEARAQTDG